VLIDGVDRLPELLDSPAGVELADEVELPL
jgi:hypothetical protein